MEKPFRFKIVSIRFEIYRKKGNQLIDLGSIAIDKIVWERFNLKIDRKMIDPKHDTLHIAVQLILGDGCIAQMAHIGRTHRFIGAHRLVHAEVQVAVPVVGIFLGDSDGRIVVGWNFNIVEHALTVGEVGQNAIVGGAWDGNLVDTAIAVYDFHLSGEG